LSVENQTTKTKENTSSIPCRINVLSFGSRMLYSQHKTNIRLQTHKKLGM